MAAHPAAALRRIVTALERYWAIALARHWPRIRALLEADVAYRLEQLAAGGVAQLFSTPHPSVRFDGNTLRIVKCYDGHAELGRRGLVLLPCAFAWPDVLVRTADPQPALTYTPRGLGRLWDAPHTGGHDPLSDVIGGTRANLLAHLDLPMTTTQLAAHLELTAPTVNAHLRALHAAGILDARRHGRGVLYARTPLAEQLLTAAPRRTDRAAGLSRRRSPEGSPPRTPDGR